jgi:hypothetical protein
MSKEQKHTPGPWIVDGVEVYALDDCEFHSVADASCNYTCRDEVEAIANARLIAEAPETAAERDRLKEINVELLEALIWIADISDKNHDDPTLRAAGARTLRRIGDRADAAIAKATGKS